MVAQHCEYIKYYWIVHIKMGNSMFCTFYVNKKYMQEKMDKMNKKMEKFRRDSKVIYNNQMVILKLKKKEYLNQI